MKYLFLWGILAGVMICAAPCSAADVQIQTGVQYDYWEDNKDNRGSQAYVPVKLSTSLDSFRIDVLAGYANSHVKQSDGTEESLSNALDTTINLSYELLKKLPVDILFGFDVNLPTGKTDFMQNELVIIMDPDLVSINTFGEGFNVNPTVNMVKNWGDWITGLGVGYVWRGEYDFSENLQDYDPGDIVNASAEIRYYFLPEWHARLYGYYAHYGKDKTEGDDFAQEGDHYLIGAGITYDQIEWIAGVNARGVFRSRGKLQESSGALLREDSNSQGDEWIGDVFFVYNVNDSTALHTTLQGLVIEANDYPESSARFIGRRDKVSLGAGISREFDHDIRAEVTVRGFVMHDEETNFPQPADSTNYSGFSALFQLSKAY